MNKPDTQQLSARLEAAMDGMRRAASSARERLGSGLQLTRTQLEILMILGDKSGLTTGELARQLFITQSAVTQTVETLVRRDLALRRADNADRRIIRLELSPAGRTITDQVLSLRRRHLHGLMLTLDPTEIQTLITATEKITAFIEAGQQTSDQPRSEDGPHGRN